MAPASKTGRKTQWAIPALFSGATGIAFAPIFVRLSRVGPSTTAFWRMALALPLLGVWALWEKKKNPETPYPQTGKECLLLLLPGLFFAGDLAIWHWSITFTTVANATLLANFSPIFVTWGAWLLFRERVSFRFLLGMALALAGAVTLMGSSVHLSGRHVAGDVLGILTAVFYSGYLLTVTRLRNRYSTAAIMTFSGISCCLALFLIAGASEQDLLPGTWEGWLVLIGLALVSQVGGQGLITYALAYLPAPFASVGLLLQPMLAALLAWICLKETMGGMQGLGGIMILWGIFLAKTGSRNSKTD